MKKLASVVTHRDRDGGGTEDQPTTFEYDPTGRVKRVPFPDGSEEDSTYECKDGVGYICDQIHTWATRKGQIKTIVYDARGRETSHTWNDGQTPGITRVWDAASRMTSISNVFSTIDYAYDDAGQPRYEGNDITGAGGRAQINYRWYPNGAIATVSFPFGGNLFRKDYTARGQLKTTGPANASGNFLASSCTYYYYPDGKMEHQEYYNGVTTSYDYDGRGMMSGVHHYRASPYQNYNYRSYYRDERDRVVAWQKSGDNSVNPMEDGRGSHYYYDGEGELTDAYYGAADPLNNPNGWGREDHFNYDALGNRRSWDYVASRGQWMNFTRKDNGLNQYRAWWNYSVINYDDDIGGSWGVPGTANGVIMQDGNVTAGFNALNQPMMIYGAATAPNWMFFGYDPLGRCVKRWVASLVNGEVPPANSNPATYLYYDGWSLIQDGAGPWNPTTIYAYGNRTDDVLTTYNFGTGQGTFRQYDANGNCSLLTGDDGSIVEQYDYDAFGYPYYYDASGNALSASAYDNRFLFTGREWIKDLKLYDYRNRMYQPELGRFLQPDPKEFAAGDYNLYRYCHNDPVNKSDPTGLDIAVVVGGEREDSANPFGHVSIAIQGQGVFSFGTQDANGVRTGWGSSTTEFVRDQGQHRSQTVYRIKTDQSQDSAARQKLDSVRDKALPNLREHPIDARNDNCSTRTRDALRAAGIEVGDQHTPNGVARGLEEKAKSDSTISKLRIDMPAPSLVEKLRDFDKSR
ncbi:MAG: hypothetical protein QOF24_2053 [Verrucomicrobiota bacterium]|jgi:RHS repeat-associated protein